jgi:GNAT superfamily N-acetyltransferase
MKSMDNKNQYTIKKLTPDFLNDYLSFFDRDAFADNPGWSWCYCRCHHFPHDQRDWNKTTAQENRTAVINLINDGIMQGYLAYVGGTPVGWCNAGPRVCMTTTPDYEEPDEEKIGAIMCFVIAHKHRRRGIARQLLDAACKGFVAQGFTFAEGYPNKGAKGDAMNFPGPLELYLSVGFEHYRQDEEVYVVRKKLV